MSICHRYLELYGKKWYYYLKVDPQQSADQLLSDYSLDQIKTGLVVQLTYKKTRTDKKTRLFSYFRNPAEFLKYEAHFPLQKRCFFETVFGQFPQKPHFDLDIDLTNQNLSIIESDIPQVINELISAIRMTFNQVGIQIYLPTDVLLFTSHGKNKKSFHLVINHHYHSNHKEARIFYQLVISKISPRFHRWIDGSVYSSVQQFRLEGSQKYNSGRIKRLRLEWYYNNISVKYRLPKAEGETIDNREIVFRNSLVGYRDVKLSILPSFSCFIESSPNTNHLLSITDQEGYRALEMVAELAGVSVGDPSFPYQLSKIEGGLVVLKRLRSSICRICDRVHENENPYLIIMGQEKSVYFNCRRNEKNKSLFIGKMCAGDSEERNLIDSGPTLEELKKMPVLIPTVDHDGNIVSPVDPPKKKQTPTIVIPEVKSIVQLGPIKPLPSNKPVKPTDHCTGLVNPELFQSGPTEYCDLSAKLRMDNMRKLSTGTVYQTKNGRIRGKDRPLGPYSPPIDLLVKPKI